VAKPGGRAILLGGGLVLVFGIMGIVLSSRGGSVWGPAIPVALGLLFLGAAAVGRWRWRRLWRTGACCEGELVHAFSRVHGTGDDRHVVHLVQYEYAVDGVPRSAKHAIDGKWEEGPIWVVYDPSKPGHSMPVRGT
jgi:hypothetical protein